MKCEEVKRFAHAFIDGEFDAGERVLIEDHLTECEECRRDLHALAIFRKALVRKLGPPRLGAESRERITQRVRDELHRAHRRLHFTVPAAAAASLLVVLSALFLYQSLQAPDEIAAIVDESIAAHEASLPPEIEGSNEAIQGYLAKHEEVVPEPPLKESEATRLVGVRLTRIGKSKALLYRYLHDGRNISVVQLPRRLAPDDELPRPVPRDQARVIYTGARNGHNVTTFESPGYTNTVVGDIPDTEMLKLVPASL